MLGRQMRQVRRRNNPIRAIHCCLALMNRLTWVVFNPDLAEAAIWRGAQDIPRYVFMIGKHLFFMLAFRFMLRLIMLEDSFKCVQSSA